MKILMLPGREPLTIFVGQPEVGNNSDGYRGPARSRVFNFGLTSVHKIVKEPKYKCEMIVNVNQRIWTLLGRKYIVMVDADKKYIIERYPFSIKPKYFIKESKSRTQVGSIIGKIKIKADAVIKLAADEYHFQQDAVTSMSYSCRAANQDETYRVQGHHGYTTSVFKNGKQIGWWAKNSFVILHGDRYEIEMNFDENPLLIACFVVLVDNYRFAVKFGGDMGWEGGNIGKGLTYRDMRWRPKTR